MSVSLNFFITGAGGTVGTAWVNFLVMNGHHVSGVDHNETNVAALRAKYSGLDMRTGDFADVDLRGYDILIHLAALKHVDLCEMSPHACVSNNVVKTQQLFQNARLNNCRIIFMSTDKAVEPISMYGYSKALAEGMAWEFGGSVIRSGNIMASSGSVMRIWDEAIAAKQPLKITHRDMVRYFISPENLVKRAWKQLDKALIIPEMDMEIKLIDLAKEKLASHGYTLENYPPGVEYIGLRPGEKLREKLV